MENSINEKPYIEYDGQKYEFEASFKLKREFDKETKSYYQKMLSNGDLSMSKIEEVKELQKFVEENPNLNIEELDDETAKKLLVLAGLVDTLDLTTVYDKYCFKMLEAKYNIDRETFDNMLEGFADDYGIEYVDILEQKVCEKVFTQQVESQEKKPLPEWMA